MRVLQIGLEWFNLDSNGSNDISGVNQINAVKIRFEADLVLG